MSDGNGHELALSFLESVTGYSETGEAVTPPSEDRPVKLGTIDPSWTTGNPRVLFDGETIMGVRGYPWAGTKPRPGERVVLVPQGRSYVIVGALARTPGAELPTGTIIEGLWSTAPVGFLLLDGTVQTRATYPALFDIVGTTYNTGGETSAQFRLPDMRGRVTAMKAVSGTFGTLGAKVGVEDQVINALDLEVTSLAATIVNASAFETASSNAPVTATSGARHKYRYPATGNPISKVQPTIVVQRAVRY